MDEWEDGGGGGGGPWWAPEGEGGMGPPWGPGEGPWDEWGDWPPVEEDLGPPPEWERGGGGGPWERDPWGPPEEGLGGRHWAPHEAEDRPPAEREGRGGRRRWRPPEREEGRERSWGPPEREGRGRSREPPERNGRGAPEREGRAGEAWAAPQEEPGPRSGPLSILGWEPQRVELRSRWGSPREEAGQESQAPLRGAPAAKPWRDRSESPGRSRPLEKLRRTRWDTPEGREGELPSRSQRPQDSPEGLRREGSRDRSYPARHQVLLDAIGIGGQWSGPKEMPGVAPGPSRGEWGGWERPRWQTGEERDRYSPKLEEGREQRGRGRQYDGESAAELPHRHWRLESPQAGFQGEWGPGADRVDREVERDQKEEEGHGGDMGDDAEAFAEAFMVGPIPEPKPWTPCEEVISYWARCRSVMKKKNRRYMLATCPRPTLPDKSSETPELNGSILAMLKPHQQKEIAGASRSLRILQDEVLDMLGPAMAVYEMAEEALQKGKAVDPVELREGARRVVRCIGSLNQTLTLQRRVVVLGAIQPRLKCVTSKMSSVTTDGMLFAEDKVKLLKEIIKRFPQLAQNPQPPRKARAFVRSLYYKRRVAVRSDPRRPYSAEKPYRRSPEFPPAYFAADQHEEEDP